jgi:hypothetical protein
MRDFQSGLFLENGSEETFKKNLHVDEDHQKMMDEILDENGRIDPDK